MFTTRHGEPLMHNNVYKAFQKLCERAGVPRQSLYALRHLSISLRIHQGANVREIMEDAGHSQVSLTLGTYAHIFESARRDSANRMDNFLQSISPVEAENLPEVEPPTKPQFGVVEPEVMQDPPEWPRAT